MVHPALTSVRPAHDPQDVAWQPADPGQVVHLREITKIRPDPNNWSDELFALGNRRYIHSETKEISYRSVAIKICNFYYYVYIDVSALDTDEIRGVVETIDNTLTSKRPQAQRAIHSWDVQPMKRFIGFDYEQFATTGNLAGTPASLPTSWMLASGYLVGPKANLNGAVLNGDDLSNATINGADLSNTSLNGVNFTGANLTGANLTGAAATGANFTGANLSKALVYGLFDGANLTNANLAGTFFNPLTLASLSSGGIIGAPASMATGWSIVHGYLVGPLANLIGANLNGANLAGVVFAGANLTNADITNADLSGANLSSSILTGVHATGATNSALTSCPNGHHFGDPAANCPSAS